MPAAAIPLATLRVDLDRGWPPGTRWVSAGGPAAADLRHPVGTTVAFPLRSSGRLRLRGRAAFAAPAPGLAGSRLRVSVRDADGERRIWSGTQRRLGGRVVPGFLRLAAELSARGEAELLLAADGPADGEAIWSGLALEPAAAAATAPPSSPPARSQPLDAGAKAVKPLFSVLTPVHDPPLDILEAMVDSVLGQTFADWELCLLDDGSRDPAVRAALQRFAAADSRIHLGRHEQAGGISAATNAALAMAGGEYVALLDHDDLLVPDALAQVAAVLAERPETDMVYSDEEQFGAGTTHVFAKPHWSPELLRSQMYVCHLGVYRRRVAEEAGGFRSEFDGSQDFDFALRVSERTDRVVHIPRVLYRWRAHAGSAAGSVQAKPAAYPAARRAIADHLERTGVEGEVHFGPWQGIYRVVHRPRPGTRVAVRIVDPSGGEEAAPLLASLADEGACGIAAEATVAPTLGAALATPGGADVVVVCEEAVEPLTRLWLARLAGFAQQPGVAAVGARTLAPGGRVERSGLAFDDGLPVPLLLGAGAGDPGPLGVGLLPSNAAAVGGVVAVASETLSRLGGIEAGLADLALPDLCLRGVAAGMRVVSAPDVLLRRRAPRPPANDLDAMLAFRARWAGEFSSDPYFDLDTTWPSYDAAVARG